MRGCVLAAAVLSLAIAAPVRAQGSIWDPPHAGTPTVGSSGWTVSAMRGWPGTIPELSPAGCNIPATWAVVTILAWPDPARGSALGVWLPGHATSLTVWDPRETYRLGGRTQIRSLTSLCDHQIAVTVPNAIGGRYPAHAVASVFAAIQVPEVFTVAVSEASGRPSSHVTLRTRDIR
ncbi:MAG TPA: hypothetical protein PLE61_10445 [Vicinamibacterales bacterium]|nr:hypothetical protein [Vicinamibacterales bacterium]